MLDFNKRNRSERQINDSEDLFAADDNFEEETMPEAESVKSLGTHGAEKSQGEVTDPEHGHRGLVLSGRAGDR